MVSKTPNQACFCSDCASKFLENAGRYAVLVTEVPNLLGTMHRCGRCLKQIPEEHYAIRAELFKSMDQFGYRDRILERAMKTGESGPPDYLYIFTPK